MDAMNPLLIEQVKRHEGFRADIYHCTAGKRTIGYGRNLDANPLYQGRPVPVPLSRELAEEILNSDLGDVAFELQQRCAAYAQGEAGPRRDVLINMAFNLGVPGLLKFRRLLGAFAVKNWIEAAAQMEDSDWHRQVKGRALELEKQMIRGEYA
jgi:lysozyme